MNRDYEIFPHEAPQDTEFASCGPMVQTHLSEYVKYILHWFSYALLVVLLRFSKICIAYFLVAFFLKINESR